ncbi:hypothetical protein I8748_24800 [Nostoc sp. CENA67]|uniref:Uncharacterized protein n=2 Tax=Amazonocrinis TaxID=2840440 RepID=A0A8J7HXJ2_9NOST|nr:hypothetical protein [Amazonocrinis nigriterrae CENA67]
MTFEQLHIGDYFQIPGISARCVYRKASSFQCSVNALLQPIRPGTEVIVLTSTEVAEYFAAKHDYLNSLCQSI